MELFGMNLSKPQKKRPVAAPVKKTMNFVHHESSFHLYKVLPVIVIVVLAGAVFVKVGFLDQTTKKVLAYNELAAAQERLAAANSRLFGYDELAHQYGRYSYGWMNESEISMVDRIEAMELVENEIAPYATVETLAINGNVLTMNISSITLEDASNMVLRLEANSLVQKATIHNAVAAEAKDASISLTVILAKEVEADE